MLLNAAFHNTKTVSTLPIRNGNSIGIVLHLLENRFFPVSTLPIRNGNAIALKEPLTKICNVSTLPIRNGN